MRIEERNKKIKKVLSEVFGYKNVSVKGGRGSAYGWVEVKIKTKKSYLEVLDIVHRVLKANGLWDQIFTYYDDMGEERKEINIDVISD